MRAKGRFKLHYVFLAATVLCLILYAIPWALPLQLQPKALAEFSGNVDTLTRVRGPQYAGGRIWITIPPNNYISSADGATWTPPQTFDLDWSLSIWLDDAGAYGITSEPAKYGSYVWFGRGWMDGPFIFMNRTTNIGNLATTRYWLVKSGNYLYLALDPPNSPQPIYSSSDGGKTWAKRGNVNERIIAMAPVDGSKALVLTTGALYQIPTTGLVEREPLPIEGSVDVLALATDPSAKRALVLWEASSEQGGPLWAALWSGTFNPPMKIADYCKRPLWGRSVFWRTGYMGSGIDWISSILPTAAAARISGGWAIFWINDQTGNLWRSAIFCRTLSDDGQLSFDADWGGPTFVTGRANKITFLSCDRGSPTASTIHLAWVEEIGQKYCLVYAPFSFSPATTVTTTVMTTITNITTTTTVAPTTTTATSIAFSTRLVTLTQTIIQTLGTSTIVLGTETYTTPIVTTYTTTGEYRVIEGVFQSPPQPSSGFDRSNFLWAALASGAATVLTWPSKRGRR